MNNMEKLAQKLVLDIKVGDVLLGGKFKNKRVIVREIGTDDLGQPTVNGRKLLSFRIEKKLPKNKQSRITRMNKVAFVMEGAGDFWEKQEGVNIMNKEANILTSGNTHKKFVESINRDPKDYYKDGVNKNVEWFKATADPNFSNVEQLDTLSKEASFTEDPRFKSVSEHIGRNKDKYLGGVIGAILGGVTGKSGGDNPLITALMGGGIGAGAAHLLGGDQKRAQMPGPTSKESLIKGLTAPPVAAPKEEDYKPWTLPTRDELGPNPFTSILDAIKTGYHNISRSDRKEIQQFHDDWETGNDNGDYGKSRLEGFKSKGLTD